MERLHAESISLETSATVRDAMSLLDRSAKQIALVTERTGKLVGLVTDGDIRRGLLSSVVLDDPITVVMNRDFLSVNSGYEPSLVSPLMASRGIKHLPVINSDGEVVEVLLNSDRKLKTELVNPVVIMAGGRGSRLRPLTDEMPKPMLAVGGVPILEIILRNYAAQGFRNFIIAVGYLGGRIEEYFGDGSFLNVSISYLREDQPLGTAGALSSISHSTEEPILISNADVISSINLVSLLETHRSGNFDMTVVSRRQELQVQFGVLEIESGRVRSWREKPRVPLLVSAGIYAMNVEALQFLPVGYADMPDIVNNLLDNGRNVGAYDFEDLWIDVGSHEELQTAIRIGRLLTGREGDA